MRAVRVRQDDAATQQAVADVVQTGEKLVADRLTLLQHDVMDEVRRIGAIALSLALSVLFALAAFVTLTVGLVLVLGDVIPTGKAALCVGGAYGALAAGLGLRASRSRRAKAP